MSVIGESRPGLMVSRYIATRAGDADLVLEHVGKAAIEADRQGFPSLAELRTLKLNRPIYRRTASYGHFGRAPEKDGGFSWEKTDLVKELKAAF